MKTLKSLNRRPLIAATLFRGDNLIHAARKASRLGADFIEVRMDSFPPKERGGLGALLKKIKKSVPLPIIATARSPKEQEPRKELFRLDAQERRALLEAVLPLVEMIDVELSSKEINASLVKQAHRLGKKAILSYHDFHSMPSEEKIQRLAQEFKSLSGDIFKVAATPKNELDIGKFLSLCSSLNQMERIFIAMGRTGALSRIAGFSFGSCLTYGHINKKIVPGQISVRKLVELCKLFYPSFTS